LNRKEFNDFLIELANIPISDRHNFIKSFYDLMVEKYNNKFEQNGLIDELIELLNKSACF